MRSTSLNKNKKEILKQLETDDIKHITKMINYNYLIIKAYLQDNPNRETFFIDNISALRIPLDSFEKQVTPIILNSIFANLDKNVFRLILKDYILNFRAWF